VVGLSDREQAIRDEKTAAKRRLYSGLRCTVGYSRSVAGRDAAGRDERRDGFEVRRGRAPLFYFWSSLDCQATGDRSLPRPSEDILAGLFRHDKRDMQKVDYGTVKALELKAPGTSTSDTMTLFHQLKKGEIFGAFNMDRRMEIWAKLHAWEGLIHTLWTFFENFKYIEVCANCVKNLITVPFRGTLYTAMARSFSETTQTRGKYIIQEAEAVFAFRSSNTKDRVALHYRELFLYVMRHLRELSPGSTKVEPKPAQRKIRITKDPDKSTLCGLADLAERLGFKSIKISDLKAKYSSHADVRSQSRPSKPTFVVDGPGECRERRCACPYDLAYEQSRDFLFLDNMHSTDRSQGSSVQPVFVRKSVLSGLLRQGIR